MRVLVLASGGDAPGMNKFIAQLYKKYGKNLFACKGGFKGLYDNDIYPASYFEPLKYENAAGCCIKSSRFAQFKEKMFFDKCLKNAQDYDAVVVIGGNGSKAGVRDMADHGMRAVFVPGTIDNDVEDTEYCIGFHTAVSAVCSSYCNLMPSMEAFSRCCIIETMGRSTGHIAETAAQILQPTFLITEKDQLNEEKIVKEIKKAYKKGQSTSVIIRENICDVRELAKRLEAQVAPAEVRSFTVGHLQRATAPTKAERKIAAKYAHGAIKAIGTDKLPIAIMLQGGKTVLKKI